MKTKEKKPLVRKNARLRDITLTVKLNVFEYTYVEAMAKLEGLSRSEFVRSRLMLPKQ